MIHSRLKFREEWVDKMIRKPMDFHPWAVMEGTRELRQRLSYDETDYLTKRLYSK